MKFLTTLGILILGTFNVFGEGIYEDHLATKCQGLNQNPSGCFWWAKRHPKYEKPYENLVIYFAGGEQFCALPESQRGPFYGKVADQYNAAGFLFVCANLFGQINPNNTSSYPYHAESQRVNGVIEDILASSVVKIHWSGKNLLISGVSHGATATPLALKSLSAKNLMSVQRAEKTAACFLDGQFDVYYNQHWWLEEQKSTEDQKSCLNFYRRTVCQRYLGRETCAKNLIHPEMFKDSLVSSQNGISYFTKNSFAIKKWKIIECGSRLSGCDGLKGNLLPEVPQRAFCDALNSSGSNQCTYESYPDASHSQCGLAPIAGDGCISWFKQL